MLQVPDPFDPNFVDFQLDYEHRIYAPDMERWALVDAVDYWHFSEYAWCIKSCRANKEYFRRAVAIWENQVRVKTVSVYLHVEIMKRVAPSPSVHHVKVDHRNGNSLDCRRANLRWATNYMNNRNRNGSHPHDLVEG